MPSLFSTAKVVEAAEEEQEQLPAHLALPAHPVRLRRRALF